MNVCEACDTTSCPSRRANQQSTPVLTGGFSGELVVIWYHTYSSLYMFDRIVPFRALLDQVDICLVVCAYASVFFEGVGAIGFQVGESLPEVTKRLWVKLNALQSNAHRVHPLHIKVSLEISNVCLFFILLCKPRKMVKFCSLNVLTANLFSCIYILYKS